jgi:hypothetical protein
MHEFVILKTFFVLIHSPNAPCHTPISKITATLLILEIIWNPPIISWIKCNFDGATTGYPGPAACSDIFRDDNMLMLWFVSLKT